LPLWKILLSLVKNWLKRSIKCVCPAYLDAVHVH
jgi:hypothetical protein